MWNIDLMRFERSKEMKRIKVKKWAVVIFLITLFSIFFIKIQGGFQLEKLEEIFAYSKIEDGLFKLEAYNRWNESSGTNNAAKTSYAELKWDKIDNLTQSGYRLFQSEDSGNTWQNQSMNYGKSIKVLNVYPDREDSNNLKTWMEGLNLKSAEGDDLIQVTPMKLTDFNGDPDSLKNNMDEYSYDVIMFGSWDANNGVDISEEAAVATKAFIESGRGVLFGHDTVYKAETGGVKQNWWKYFHDDKNYLGVGHDPAMESIYGVIENSYMTGSEQVKVINDGYLMKYPFEMANELVLTIPYAHNIELSDKSVGTTWAEFANPSGTWPNPIHDDNTWRGGWYLKTNNNVAMIQTGHSNGDSTEDEQKIIANVLYNLAQVSLENSANDYSVKDDKAPDKPVVDIRCGYHDDMSIRIDAKDNGKKYRWYVEADVKDEGIRKSDTVEEEIASNIAGYFYQIVENPSDSSTTTFKKSVEDLKDGYGRITEDKFQLYVAPNNNSTEYTTAKAIVLAKEGNLDKYMQVIAVDRMSNVSDVQTVKIGDLVQQVDFEVERTGDQCKIFNPVLQDSLDGTMETLQINVPKNASVDGVTLPDTWTRSTDKTASGHDSYIYQIKKNNALDVIKGFLADVTMTINSDVDASGVISLTFSKKAGEVNDDSVCWNADIPQKISLKAYDEDDNPLSAGDLVYDQKLRIGGTVTVTPKSLDFYEFLELRNLDGTTRPLSYTVTNTLQKGNLIYSLRKATLHVRQKIIDSSSDIVVPEEGYLNIDNRLNNNGSPTVDPNYQADARVNSGVAPTFTEFVLSTKHLSSGLDQVRINPVIPAFYQYAGHYKTTNVVDPQGQSHELPHSYDTNPITLERQTIDAGVEFWITIYIEPNVDEENKAKTPQPYSWDYKKNDLGSIKPKE